MCEEKFHRIREQPVGRRRGGLDDKTFMKTDKSEATLSDSQPPTPSCLRTPSSGWIHKEGRNAGCNGGHWDLLLGIH